ncbi:MAG: SctK family type III secretion system sorting platform protein [Gammaproteobacteria bacterium]
MTEQLFDKSYVLNFLPARYLHDSWWENIKDGKELQLLSRKSEAEVSVSKLILEHFDLKDSPLLKFDTPQQKISLLSPYELTKFVMLLGLVSVCDQIKQTITKVDVVDFKNQLGVDMYNFAIEQATSMYHQIPTLTQSSLDMRKPLNAQVFANGLIILGRAINDEDKALVTRLVLKLGKASFSYLSDRSQLTAYKKSSCVKLIELLTDHFNSNLNNVEAGNTSDLDQGVINEEDN